MSLFKPLCKFCATVTSLREIVPTVRKALQAAVSGTPGEMTFDPIDSVHVLTLLSSVLGPVFIEFPIDTLYEYSAVSKEVGASQGGKSFGQRIVGW